MTHTSIPVAGSPIEVVKTEAISPLIDHCYIKVCYVGEDPNRNGSVITKEVADQMASSLRGCPIVGKYYDDKKDFGGHDQSIEISGNEWHIKDTTQPYGFVPTDAQVWYKKFNDDGVEHEYLMTEGYLWTSQYPEAKRVITEGNNQSMELDGNSLKGDWAEDPNSGLEFFIINEAVISKLCILGNDVEPCFEGANVTGKMQFSFDESFQQKLTNLKNEVNKMTKNEGGTESVEENKEVIDVSVQNPAPAADPEPAPAPAPEEPAEPAPAAQEPEAQTYNLADIPEYVELEGKFKDLTTKFNNLDAEYKKLLEFKNSIELKQKQAKINEFDMLSDEDKKDIIGHINDYSVTQIEEKLSAICFRKKISFTDSLENKSEEKPEDGEKGPISTFSLESDVQDDVTPAWIKAALATKKEMESK